ncbi:hypothetical protein JYU34_009756 [Plutella xylostella]|uniref:HMG box domain-containing protein n=1 Tax=Plutella xylostella TaxID=51655 RepID=A0ABQ7QKC1_PLUXY|nr:high mobility group protein DSP1 isoform X2 [Plutella xylostella]KAG7305656.1 hypothetical protein JYU34_009756 [Plutella xylostella]
MGDQGATGGAWGARDEASWWPGGAGELQNQQQLNEEIARSTAASTQQLYTYKMTGGQFTNNSSENTSSNYGYRLVSNNREESPQQQWWYSSGAIDSQQQNSSPTPQNQSSPDAEHGNQQSNGQQNHQQLLQQEQQQNLQQQSLQQALQQQNQQQTLQQMLQQHQQQQQSQQQSQQQQLQQSLQQTLQVSQAQAQVLVQAQQALQQQVAQSLQQQQLSLHDHIQAVQQHQIQAALQRQSATLQELQQQAQQQALLAQATATKGRMPRARAGNKPRGRMTAYAFFVQTCREEHKKKHPDENVIFAAFSKKCAERWNTMSEKEKQRFHEMAEHDKKRYDLEMQTYVPPKDVKMGRGRKRHQIKDPNAPKRSLSAFFWFCNDERSKVKANNPEYTMGDIAKELGRRWAAALPETKTKYEALSEQDKARYDREMTAYKKGPLLAAQQAQQQQAAELEEDVGDFEAEDEYN